VIGGGGADAVAAQDGWLLLIAPPPPPSSLLLLFLLLLLLQCKIVLSKRQCHHAHRSASGCVSAAATFEPSRFLSNQLSASYRPFCRPSHSAAKAINPRISVTSRGR